MDDQTHYTPQYISKHGVDTQAYWAIKPTGTLAVFVHGFAGRAVETWTNFPQRLLEDPRSAGWDIVFFGYDGIYESTLISASRLEEMLQNMVSNPAKFINGPIRRNVRANDFAYTRIKIVAHSMGAVVARRALLTAHDANSPWLNNTQLVLFAPAHMGARILALGGEALSAIPGFGHVLAAAGRFKFRPLEELDKDSNTLQVLRDNATTALATGTANYLRAARVYHAEGDTIVYFDPFCRDPNFTRVDGRRHMDICKPCKGYDLPVSEIIEL